MKKPFEEMIQHLKKLGLVNGQATNPPAVGLVVSCVLALFFIEIFLMPDWFESWMLLPVIVAWGLVQSYKYSYGKGKADLDAGE